MTSGKPAEEESDDALDRLFDAIIGASVPNRGALGSTSLDAVLHKLDEAKFFLGRLARIDDPVQAQYFLSAFVSAGRTTTFCLQAAFKRTTRFDDWYAPRQLFMASSPVCKLMKEVRNEMLHSGDGGIQGGGTAPGRKMTFRFDERWMPKVGIDRRKNDVVGLCREYHEILCAVVADCFESFRSISDPHVYLTPEWLKARGETIEDVEEFYGYRRGWTAVEGSEDEWPDRIRLLLRRTPPWPDVSDIRQAVSEQLLTEYLTAVSKRVPHG